jgi:hypothetical protein
MPISFWPRQARRFFAVWFESLQPNALLFRVRPISPHPPIQFALHLLTGNVSPFLIPKKEKVFATRFSQSRRIRSFQIQEIVHGFVPATTR